ncbi:MAG: vitamin B12 dependent-methionine synthase activation domain-containing protein, partial [Pseudomonadota bacterium]
RPHMGSGSSQNKGKFLIATVKGDVHDIGKNLVEIVLSNNGFEVINLGIKVPSAELIAAIKEHKPDIVGLSGLLVKSALQMVITAEDFTQSGINVPLMVGGAALSRKFTLNKIGPAYSQGTVIYAKDAMDGLKLANAILDPKQFSALKEKLQKEKESLDESANPSVVTSAGAGSKINSIVPVDNPPAPSDFQRHVLKTTPLPVIWSYINPMMLYARHLGVKGPAAKLIGEGKIEELKNQDNGQKITQIWQAVEEVKKVYGPTHLMPRAVYQFFPCTSEGNKTFIFSEQPSTTPVATFDFPRQKSAEELCLSDYVMPSPSGKKDNLCLFVVSIGNGVAKEAQRLKEKGDYLFSHILSALALETAEGYAEWLHEQIRRMWGFSDPPGMTMLQRFQAQYRGKRYSFGYPACPRLEDQQILFKLLHPEEIDIQLTEGMMMDPEASVSAIVFHHPQASYYSVGPGI